MLSGETFIFMQNHVDLSKIDLSCYWLQVCCNTKHYAAIARSYADSWIY